MSLRINCYTLFDITKTNVPNRSKPAENVEYTDWLYKRNTQSNFDTILQAISLRSQPEIVKEPQKLIVDFDSTEFGYEYLQEQITCWTFQFEIHHSSVFTLGDDELGALYLDCDGVPMTKCGTEIIKVNTFLDVSPEYKNIYFIKV